MSSEYKHILELKESCVQMTEVSHEWIENVYVSLKGRTCAILYRRNKRDHGPDFAVNNETSYLSLTL